MDTDTAIECNMHKLKVRIVMHLSLAATLVSLREAIVDMWTEGGCRWRALESRPGREMHI